ncbi:MAG: hypothetical protein ABWY20_06065 [Mycobacterium sp.]
MTDSSHHTPDGAPEPARRAWSGDEIVHDQNQHPRHPDRTAWSGDEIVHDQNQHNLPSRDS